MEERQKVFQSCTDGPHRATASRVSALEFFSEACPGEVPSRALRILRRFFRAVSLLGTFRTNLARSDQVNALDLCKESQVFAVRAFRTGGEAFSTWFSTFLLKTFWWWNAIGLRKTRNGKTFPL
jgi:hypothetical protein